MSLHVEVMGQGDPLVMLHGWGMHGGMWGDIVVQLAQNFEVHCVDLPGHGKSVFSETSLTPTLSQRERGEVVLDDVVQQLSSQFDAPVTVCGWSLGGMIAQYWAACEPEKIKRLVLVASTPCFSEREDWHFGMSQATLRQFSDELEKSPSATLRRFLALQVRGSEGERELLQRLRKSLFSRGEPHFDGLRGGLEILRDADLRSVLPKVKQPTLVVAGERDKLTPPAASQYLAENLPNGHLAEIKGAAHAPFLSHPEIFIEHLRSFLHE
jgi:pimeloyl-[acyl-carrier protein] methyl ester esterase